MKHYKQNARYYASTTALAIAMAATPQAFAQSSSDTRFETTDEVVVTARKRDETVLEIPISIDAFSQGDIDKLGATSAEQLSQFTPGFDFQNVGTGGASGRANPQIRFRGVGTQISDPNAPTAAIFYDGVYVPQGIGLLPLVDLERVEVIKGPQTAFFGRNTFAGAANFIPASPTDEFEARLIGEISATDADEGYSLSGTISGPIGERIRGRLTGSTEQTAAAHEFGDGAPLGRENLDALIGSLDFDVSDSITLSYTGYFVEGDDTAALSSINADVPSASCDQTYNGSLRNIVTGEDLGSFSTDLSVAPAQQFPFGPFVPVINTDTSTLFCGDIPDFGGSSQIDPAFGGAPTVALFSDTPAGFGAFGPVAAMTAEENFLASSFFNNITAPEELGSFVSPPRGLGNTYKTWRHKLSFAADVGEKFTLDGYVSAGRFGNWGTFDSNYGAAAIPTYAGFINNNEDESAELRLSSSDGNARLRYSLGVNYQEQDSDAFQAGFNILTSIESETLGLFGAVDFDITDQLTISGEGRWQDDESKVLADGAPGADFETQTQDFQKFMPRVILSYQPENLDLNLYGSWSQSYLAGNQTGASSFAAALDSDGPNDFDADAAGFFTPIQKLDAYEIGLKHQLNSQLRYSISAYQMDWENQVFFVLSPTFVSLSQAGDSEYTGIEVEVEYKPSNWLSLQGAFNYVDGEFTDYVATGSVGSAVLAPGLVSNTVGVVADGNEIRYNPALTGTFSAEVALDGIFNLESFLRVDGVYTGDFFIDNFEFNEVGASTRINLRAGAQFTDKLGFEIYGNNITDDLTPTTQGGTTFTAFGSQNTRRFFGQAPRGAEFGVRGVWDF